MKEPLRVLLCASECAPFAKTGGLADVIGTLPKELCTLGIDARVMIPCHRTIKENYRDSIRHLCSFSVHLGWRCHYAGVEILQKDGVTVYLIDNEYYFGDLIYRGRDSETEQYAFFSRAVLEALPLIDFVPHIIHSNDWHTAMLPMLIKTQYTACKQGGIKTLLTVHNLFYQGKCAFEKLNDLLSIDRKYYTGEFIEAHGCANFLKAGFVFADRLSTVSPSYAFEIQNEPGGEGLSGILRARSHQLSGILNGIDTCFFSPQTDPLIPHRFSANDLSGKRKMKEHMLFSLGLNVSPDTPVIAMISRLTKQKGIDMIADKLYELMALDAAFVFLGQGERYFEDFLRKAEHDFSGRICSYIGYSEQVAHMIYAGADFLLMPSVFEPCGLSQMISMRYGTLPVVRETGGLKDTVIPYNQYTGQGDGFSFANCTSFEMADALRRALDAYKNPHALRRLIKNAMEKDFSFASSAQKYAELYNQMV